MIREENLVLYPKAVPSLKRDDADNQRNIALSDGYNQLSLTQENLEQNHNGKPVVIIGLGPSLRLRTHKSYLRFR